MLLNKSQTCGRVTFFRLWALLEILSGVTPRSERTLAIPLASTPQLGATLLSQRLCTFTLHTDTHTRTHRIRSTVRDYSVQESVYLCSDQLQDCVTVSGHETSCRNSKAKSDKSTYLSICQRMNPLFPITISPPIYIFFQIR